MAIAEFTNLLIDLGRNKIVNNEIKEEANKKVKEQIAEVLGISVDETKSSVIRRAYRRNRVAFCELIEDTIHTALTVDYLNTPIFQTLVEQKNIGQGDKQDFYVQDDAYLVVSEIADGTNDIIRQKLQAGKKYQIPTRVIAVKVYEEVERIFTRATVWEDLIKALYTAMDKAITDRLYGAMKEFQSFVKADLKGSGTADMQALDKILEIADRIQAKYGCEVMFAGARAALAKLGNITKDTMSNEAKRERETVGYMAHIAGVEAMVIKETYMGNTRDFAFDRNTILILPKVDDKPIKLVMEGDGEFAEDTNPLTRADRTAEAMYFTSIGVGIVFGKECGEFKFV